MRRTPPCAAFVLTAGDGTRYSRSPRRTKLSKHTAKGAEPMKKRIIADAHAVPKYGSEFFFWLFPSCNHLHHAV